jgi:osmotically-inducible protein OsmY
MSKRNTQSATLALLAALVVVPVLQGCFTLAATGMTAGSLAATDRRTVGTQVEDRTIQIKALSRISNKFGEGVHANATVYNRRVLLTGEVPDAATSAAIEREVSTIENVRLIVNDLSVEPKTTLSNRSNDTLITGKVKAAMIDAKDVFANAFKVSTERGVVYLMGSVTAKEAQRAAEVAADVSGVVKVVKVVDVISEEELQRMSAAPASKDQSGTARP